MMLRLLVSVIAVALIQVFTAIGLLLQWAPSIVRVLWRMVSAFFTLSCAGYRALFVWIAGRLGWWFLVGQPWRTVGTVVLSNSVAAAVCVAVGWQVGLESISIASIHGLIVGSAWDQLGPPSGQSLGR